MRIGVISDTHDRLPALAAALDAFAEAEVEALIHAGDYVAPFAAKLLTPDALRERGLDLPGGLHAIYGNNDGERTGLKKTLPQIVDGPVRIEIDGRRIAVAHFVDWFDEADHAWADVLISGHNHEAEITTRSVAGRDRLYLNPGECCGWLTGRCTVAILDSDACRAELIDLPEP
ncbi:MAG: YfcE family phosphodiesterase [Planctomycetota bacterium]